MHPPVERFVRLRDPLPLRPPGFLARSPHRVSQTHRIQLGIVEAMVFVVRVAQVMSGEPMWRT
jgi:hypothetical protein